MKEVVYELFIPFREYAEYLRALEPEPRLKDFCSRVGIHRLTDLAANGILNLALSIDAALIAPEYLLYFVPKQRISLFSFLNEPVDPGLDLGSEVAFASLIIEGHIGIHQDVVVEVGLVLLLGDHARQLGIQHLGLRRRVLLDHVLQSHAQRLVGQLNQLNLGLMVPAEGHYFWAISQLDDRPDREVHDLPGVLGLQLLGVNLTRHILQVLSVGEAGAELADALPQVAAESRHLIALLDSHW